MLPAVLAGGCRKSSVRNPTPPAQPAPPAPTLGDKAPIPDREPEIRVRIGRLRDESDTVEIGEAGDQFDIVALSARRPDGDDFDRERATDQRWTAFGPLTVATKEGVWHIRAGEAELTSDLPAVPLAIFRSPSVMLVNGSPYPGSLRLVPRTSVGPFAADVINSVPLERYLPGVLARELFRHWRPVTFAAQAVAARSYACSELAWFRSRRHYDVTDTTSSQMYVGLVQHPRARNAVRETRGLVLTEGGALVPGYYSSCCGGAAATATDAIGKHPWNELRSLGGQIGRDVCTAAPRYAWSVERSVSAAVERMRAFGSANQVDVLESLRGIRSITSGALNAHGRPRTLIVHTTNDEHIELAANAVRRAIDYDVTHTIPAAQSIHSAYFSGMLHGGRLVLKGHGHGHGAGLCQYGAETCARAGYSMEDVLDRYYPGANVVRAYASTGTA